MAGETERIDRRAIETISIHFDLPGHQIPLSTFIRTAEQTEAVIRSLNRELFDGNLRYELLVLPPEEGSFKSKLGFVLLGGWAVLWSFTESDVGKAFIKGLTTHEPAHWAEQVGTGLRDALIDGAEAAAPEGDEPDEEAKCQFGARIVTEATKSFLQADVSELEQVGVTKTRFRDAFEVPERSFIRPAYRRRTCVPSASRMRRSFLLTGLNFHGFRWCCRRRTMMTTNRG